MIIVLLISTIILMLGKNNHVNATSVLNTKSGENGYYSEPYDELNDEGHIMMYDAKTGKTSKVNMEQMKRTLKINGYGGYNYTSSYTPNLDEQKKVKRKLSSASTERIWPTQSPYNKAFSCVGKSKEGKTMSGSGAIVAIRAGPTVAHSIFESDKTPYKNWTCYVGIDNDGSYWGTPTGWDKVYYDNRYFENINDKTQFGRYDWAIVGLQADSAVGWFGTKSYGSISNLNGMNITLLGYPADSSLGFNGFSEYRIASTAYQWINSDVIRFNGFGASGFSGGPIYDNSDENIVAVFASGDNQNCY